MSDSKGGSNEPSMEEILSSIRRIIAEDAEQEEKGAAPQRTQPPREERDRDDLRPDEPHRDDPAVTDTYGWPEDREAAGRRAADPAGSEGEDILELTKLVNEDGSVTDLSEGSSGPGMPFVAGDDAAPSEATVEPETAVEPDRQPAPTAPVLSEDEIEDAELADETLGAPLPQVQGEVDAEVRAWLDRNLPDMVERVVREEVERMLRRLKDD